MMNLTVMEVKIINAMRNNEYNDAIKDNGACGAWSFAAIDNSGIPANQARGVISSLVKKGLVDITPADKSSHSPEVISFTQAGVRLFDNADGEECGWGGPRLLKETEVEVKEIEVKEVEKKEAPVQTTITLPTELIGKSKSETIRNLHKVGWKTGDIAKALNVRYQHAREVIIRMCK